MRYLVWLTLVCVLSAGKSQVGNGILLNNDLIATPSVQRNTLPTLWPENNCDLVNGCYAIIQFDGIPLSARKLELAEIGISFHRYLNSNAYLVSNTQPEDFLLAEDMLQVLPLEAQHKRPNAPLNFGSGEENTTTYRLVGLPFPGIGLLQLAQALENEGASILSFQEKWLTYEILIDDLANVLTCPLLQYTEAAPVAPIPEGRIGRSSSRIIRSFMGLPYIGEGMAIAIGDDGGVVHLDFQGRLVDHTQYNTGSHAEMTTGMAAGAGNIDPTTAGSAPGAIVHLFDIGSYTHVDLAPLHFEDFGTAITSTSFGEGCGEVYQISTATIDEQVYQNPQLLHVFSAGNHGTDPCYNPYSWLGANQSGNYYATITGGRKAGKNVLAIGNIDWNDELLASSSRGPTPDGRIKPDLSGLGQNDYTTGPNNTYRTSSGTSASSPNVAGALAILYGYYRETHNNTYPSSALIKALALNTADDLGVAGPDFHYGWGRLNTRKALASLQAEHYRQETISHQQTQSFQLAIPSGAQRLKVMLYWHDPAGSVLSAKALVNDLDLRVETPSGQQQLPWIPSSFPHLDSLGRAALPGLDRLNNVEQVVINQPVAGYYNLLVEGFEVPQGPQTYYLVYEIEMTPIELLSPQVGETFVPGEQALVVWDAVGTSQTFSLDVSYNNGQSWTGLATNLAPATRSYVWQVPNIPTSQLKFRLRRGSTTKISQHLGVVAGVPEFMVEYQDANTALASWEAVPGAVAYQVFQLGDKYMEIVGNTSSLNYELDAVVGETYWHSIAPVFPNGLSGRRANAQEYEHFGCETLVTIALQFDLYPGETSWYILDASGAIRHSGGPYTGVPAFSFREESICLPAGCFTLVVTDAYNDGMCCANGNGWFRLTDGFGNELVSGGEFNAISYDLFCVEENGTPPLQATTTVLNQITCANAQTGALGVTASGGSGTYTYLWSNGSQQSTIAGLGTGTYTVQINDGNQTIIRSVTLTAPSPLQFSFSVTPAICAEGSITLSPSGGTSPYQITWADGAVGGARNGLAAGAYYVVITDANGCFTTTSITVQGAPPLAVTLNPQSPNCQFANSGNISAAVTGGSGNYTYTWSNGATGSSLVGGLPAGSYSLTVTDGNCTAVASAQLVNPAGLNVTATSVAPLCHNGQDGWIALEVNSGTAPFFYFWADGAQNAIRTGLSSGVYLVTVTDAAGCNVVRGLPLQNPTELELSVSVTHATSGDNGAIALSIQGGTGPYTVTWGNGAQGQQLFNLSPGQYTAYVTDQNGCQSSTEVSVNDESTDGPGLQYCESQGANTNYEWINAIFVNGSNYASGNDDGYGDYTSIVLPLEKNATHQLTLVPGYTSTTYNEYWKVWIDYNRDGDFSDPGEQVASIGPRVGSTMVQFTPPQNAQGTTRMRISMRYGSAPTFCANINYGEVEDYTIEWIEEENANNGNMNLQIWPSTPPSADAAAWTVFPNPTANNAQLSGWTKAEEEVEIRLLDAHGRIIKKEKHWLAGGDFTAPVKMDFLPSGNYQVMIVGKAWQETLRVFKY